MRYELKLDRRRFPGQRIVARMRVSVREPLTGSAKTLAETDGEVEPFYWDARAATLWVFDRDGLVRGITATDVISHPQRRLFGRSELPAPFVREVPAGDVL